MPRAASSASSGCRRNSKDDVGERLNKTAKELYGIDNFTDMIADETICTDCDALMNSFREKNHPVLAMEPLM